MGVADLGPYRGIGQFGPAYRAMFESDAHAPGSVDRVLLERMIRLCPETAEYLYTEHTPTEVKYRKGSRPELEERLADIASIASSDEGFISGVTRFCAALGERAAGDLDVMRIGGTEEEIVRRGSDWCTDVARVACILCQVAGFSSRLVFLADTARAYCGHDIVEVLRHGRWGAVDPTTDVIYRHLAGEPASAWELMNDPGLIERHRRGGATIYTTPAQFRCAAISNYFVWEHDEYDYTVSGINPYYRSILEMSAKGWPGGLRWLHGETTPTNARKTDNQPPK